MNRFFEIIIKAAELKEHISDNLFKEDEFAHMINELKGLISSTRRERYESGMAEICADCGTSGKDCCGKGIEFKYSKELLIINMLMGAEIPSKRLSENSCYFLTEKGCSLLARHVFCINFLCQKIRDKISSERLKRLQELEGRELELSFRLEEFIKKHLKNHPTITFTTKSDRITHELCGSTHCYRPLSRCQETDVRRHMSDIRGRISESKENPSSASDI
jgi:hypothetical protein